MGLQALGMTEAVRRQSTNDVESKTHPAKEGGERAPEGGGEKWMHQDAPRGRVPCAGAVRGLVWLG